MNKKKNTKKNNNKDKNKLNLPFNNEIALAKAHFKQMIDDMSDTEFAEFSLFISSFAEPFDNEWDEDEWWDEDFYNNLSSSNNSIFDNDSLPL